MAAATMPFPIDLAAFQPLSLDPDQPVLSPDQKATLRATIQLCRDAIIVFTATGAARGVGDHGGGPDDTVPAVMILEAFFRGAPDRFLPVFFDEAGHRVATQDLISVLRGQLAAEVLRQYHAAHSRLPGHPDLGLTPGVQFRSGRLGHLWPFVNDVARFAVAHGLNVTLVIDDNDVTIAGHPSEYQPGDDLERTLSGHGLATLSGDDEDLDDLYSRLHRAVARDGPVAPRWR